MKMKYYILVIVFFISCIFYLYYGLNGFLWLVWELDYYVWWFLWEISFYLDSWV